MITNKDKIKTTPQKSYRTIKTYPFRSVKISGENRFFISACLTILSEI
jgi:hypothetical protein